MASNKNIFNVSNPMRIMDALWEKIQNYKNDFSKILIFLPSRRAVRDVERMIVDKIGHAVVLPNLVPLGTGVEDGEDDCLGGDTISTQERVIILSRLLSMDANIKNIATALPIARDFVRMQDYLNNENIDIRDIDWEKLVCEKYANHFQNKARILNILKQLPNDRQTVAQKRNDDIRAWINKLNEYECVIVCGSTGSVPATSDLMYEIAIHDNGIIILSGKISGDTSDFILDTNPYNAEYKFLQRLNLSESDVQTINVGKNDAIDFMNIAFGNSGARTNKKIDNCKLIECACESEEARVVVEIAKRAVNNDKSVLVITPDAAANQRIKTEMTYAGINADFSSGISGTMTDLGRAILNLFDEWVDNSPNRFELLYEKAEHNLYKMLVDFVDNNTDVFQPAFDVENEKDIAIWDAIKNMSDVLCKNDVKLNVLDARAFVKDSIDSIVIRDKKNDDCCVRVLGTIESRMQTADVIILTGLNEGMFPALGYENSWLPRDVSLKIGLPSPNKKVSLMALDFMNLSCGDTVYWLRSKQSGGVLITESRFLSRVRVAAGDIGKADEILKFVRNKDDVKYDPLDYSAPTPPIDKTDVYVTEIELLIHNPYAFYAKHILKLKPVDDYWILPDTRHFGILVHDVIENAKTFNADDLIREMDVRAKQILEKNSIIFYFWHKRFCEIAPFVEKYFKNKSIKYKEILGSVNIDGRQVRARADLIWDGIVMDIKTGAAPTKKQLLDGTMPQIALEGYIMQNGGFPIKMRDISITPILQFLQLKNSDVDFIEYKDDVAQEMIDNTVQKVRKLFRQYSGNEVAEYEYREVTGAKYHEWNDLARVDD